MALPRRATAPPVVAAVFCAALALALGADAQSSARRATNLTALLAFPGFYHLQSILLVGALTSLPDNELRLSDGAGVLRVISRGSAPEGPVEVRGQFWDLGRMKVDDPRLSGYDLRALFHVDADGAWPRPGTVTAIIASAITPAAPAPGLSSPPIRAIVLEPSRFLDRQVTISGQFQGRNLKGDLPDAPGKSLYDFVLRSGDASIWVTNLRPRGKDARGKDFELGVDARIDTGRWLQISGTVRQGRGLVWVDGQAGSLSLAASASEPVAEDQESAVRTPAAPAPEVVFSAPTADETGVSLETNVRIQFSRDLDPQTLKGHIRATYVDGPGDVSPTAIESSANYTAATRVVELKFAKPLERLRRVKVEILDGLRGTDQQTVKAWSMTFSLGGS